MRKRIGGSVDFREALFGQLQLALLAPMRSTTPCPGGGGSLALDDA
jgi:hypothetical protein